MKFDVWFRLSPEYDVEYSMGEANFKDDDIMELFKIFSNIKSFYKLFLLENRINNNPVFKDICKKNGYFEILLQPKDDDSLFYLILDSQLMGFEKLREDELMVKVDLFEVSLHCMFETWYTIKD